MSRKRYAHAMAHAASTKAYRAVLVLHGFEEPQPFLRRLEWHRVHKLARLAAAETYKAEFARLRSKGVGNDP